MFYLTIWKIPFNGVSVGNASLCRSQKRKYRPRYKSWFVSEESVLLNWSLLVDWVSFYCPTIKSVRLKFLCRRLRNRGRIFLLSPVDTEERNLDTNGSAFLYRLYYVTVKGFPPEDSNIGDEGEKTLRSVVRRLFVFIGTFLRVHPSLDPGTGRRRWLEGRLSVMVEGPYTRSVDPIPRKSG